jgi:hypothetical protein
VGGLRAHSISTYSVIVLRSAMRQLEAAWVAYLKPFFFDVGGIPPVELREIYKSFADDKGHVPDAVSHTTAKS